MTVQTLDHMMTPISIDDSSFTDNQTKKDSDLLEITINFTSGTEKTVVEAYPENTIRMVLSILKINPDGNLTFRNDRTQRCTTKLDITLADFEVLDKGSVTIDDFGKVAGNDFCKS
jgi:hypothetical protein